MTIKTLSVKCPICKKEVLMTKDSLFRPFCSKRCRDIDFGEWAKESYSVEGNSLETDAWSEDLE
ncbi:DNA gyrase inhibitor YacG [Agarilytica rhodophyticola]|uniref:DNA gyrase inhibitor YacG n=1 Tax=Agarilytica rhodophyticola TaxID=1737490 RepID=UPI000B345BE5|nr:DNA gyrase inhibitor YacG [Agarilytica rhodophyticola]